MSQTKPSATPDLPWYRELNRYHWFVLVVCSLGWLFDCLCQQIFILARKPAMTKLLSGNSEAVETYTTLATSMLLVGWATGGIIFGIMGDRIGRAKTMVFTILGYSLFTGLSVVAPSPWFLILSVFLTGLGVGGQFAVGVSLVAEVMPDRARPRALGLLQGLSTLGNITAAVVGMTFSRLAGFWPFLEWRGMFAVGVIPALLAVPVMMRLKEPERWRKAVAEKAGQKAGSLREMFGVAKWRHRAIVGMLLAASGVIGLWGIGFFSPDLNQSIFRKVYEQRARQAAGADSPETDRQLLRLAIQSPERLDALVVKETEVRPQALLSLDAANKDPQPIYVAALVLHAAGEPLSADGVVRSLSEPGRLAALAAKLRQTPQPQPIGDAIAIASTLAPQTADEGARRAEYLAGAPAPDQSLDACIQAVVARYKRINGDVALWAGITSMLFNIGAFFGIYVFARVTQRIGRRPAFAVAFVAAAASTIVTFLFMASPWQVFWMIPMMGFCQMSILGGYAIYFPELFPTRLRSTGTSLCYNIARYVAATGPIGLGLLTRHVYSGTAEPMRYAGATMCAVFVVGLLVLPFAPETKDEPLPE